MITTNNIIHNLNPDIQSTDENTKEKFSPLQFIFILIIAVTLGGLTGFGISKLKKTEKIDTKQKAEQAIGIVDKKTFKDSAEGILKEGGIDGEGNFHLERPGGVSQNVYLTSSTVDLSEYIGKKVRVWGATFKGEKAGWLMDVGLVEILE